MTEYPKLKSKILEGSVYLTLRQIIGLGLSLISIVVIFKYLGPINFGYLSVGMGILGYIGSLSGLGIDVFLIRKKENLTEDYVRQLFTFICLIAAVVTMLLIVTAPIVGWWVRDNKIINVIRLMSVGYFVKQIGFISQSLLERSLRYKEISFIELLGQVSYYFVAVPLVILGWSYWGVIIGGIISGLITTASIFRLRPIKIAKKIEASLLRESLKYGLSYQAAVWTWRLRDLTIPLFVSKLAGIEAVGILNASIQIVNRLSFFGMVFWRISISALAKVQDDVRTLIQGINKGMVYQLIIVGMIFSLFSFVSPWVVDILGNKWVMVDKVFPFIALGTIINGMFSLHCSALFVKGHNFAVNKFHIAHVLILWAATIGLTPFLGIWGFCFAEIMAIASYIVVHRQIIKYFERPDYSKSATILFLIAFVIFAGPWLPRGIGILFSVILVGGSLIFFPALRNIYMAFIREIMSIRKQKVEGILS